MFRGPLTGKDLLFLAGITLLFCVGDAVGYLLFQQLVFLISQTILLLFLIAFMQRNYRIYRKLDNNNYQHILKTSNESELMKQEVNNSYQQIEALFYLFSTLKIRHSLPKMRGWAISPDFAMVVINLIKDRKPKLVLELGSGVSTLVAGYSLEEVGQGRLVSLDHDEHYATLSSSAVVQHRLQDFVTLIHAPLKEMMIGDKSWLWYDRECLKNLGPVDMLIVDGPPSPIQSLARYPALPVLFHLLSDDAIIILDDASRPDEREIVRLWLKEFTGFSVEELDLEKGAALLRRQSSPPLS